MGTCMASYAHIHSETATIETRSTWLGPRVGKQKLYLSLCGKPPSRGWACQSVSAANLRGCLRKRRKNPVQPRGQGLPHALHGTNAVLFPPFFCSGTKEQEQRHLDCCFDTATPPALHCTETTDIAWVLCTTVPVHQPSHGNMQA